MRHFVTFGVVTFLCMTMGGVVLAQQPRQSPMGPDMMQMGGMVGQMGGMMGQMAEMMRSGHMTPERMEQMAQMQKQMLEVMGESSKK